MDYIYETRAFIQEFIVEGELLKWKDFDKRFDTSGKNPWTFYVHASLITKLEKRLNEMFPTDSWEMSGKILKFGDKRLVMYQIIILRGALAERQALRNLIIPSQYSFPLEENPTLFIKADSFSTMKKFITKHKLEPYIIKTEEMSGISPDDVMIKVVTFNQTVNQKLNIIKEFDTIISEQFMARQYLYLTFCLPWERTSKLRQGHKYDKVCEVFPIVLQHLETINYTNKLNIFDLLSLRLAICDIRDLLQISSMKWGIDYFIKRELAKYIQNNIFDLRQYSIDKNCKSNGLLCNYLIYEFQDCFKAVNYDYEYFSIHGTVKDCIKLKSETNVLNKITPRFNIDYSIDGRGFDQMSSSLFFAFLECENVCEIDLDTNYRWIKDVPNIIRIANSKENGILVRFRGNDTNMLVEDCIAEIKRLEFYSIRLQICCKVSDYRVLDDLEVDHISLWDKRIDTAMLTQLRQCCIRSPLAIYQCVIENNWQAWERINNYGMFSWIEIIEDEGTWEAMFEFVEKELLRTHSNVFQFAIHIRVHLNDSSKRYIDLKSFKFTIEMSQFQIRQAKSNELVDDWYNVINDVEPDENFDFEFYK